MTPKRWKQINQIVTWSFLIVTVSLLFLYLGKIEWRTVWRMLVNTNHETIVSTLLLVALSYTIYYGIFDLIGQAWCGHKLQKRQVMLIAFICYAFNMSLSTWVGGVAMRYRLYSRLGLTAGSITRIFSLSIATNWVGYMLVAGAIYSSGLTPLPAGWIIGGRTLQSIGITLLIATSLYLALCAGSPRYHLKIRGNKMTLPSLRLALLQCIASASNWMIMATIIWLLMAREPPWSAVSGVLLVSSIVGVVIHIPAGAGVLGVVFLALLGGENLSHNAILAALLTYRLLYFLIPLLLASVLYLWFERHHALRSPDHGL